jgi:ubiquinone/menaquinone biosynthesis C-methylase UbiE
MSRVQDIANPEYVNNQYRDASNLNARIRLHQEFSTNKQGWHRWLFEQFEFTSPCRILQLGCGAGNLWLENLDRIPKYLEIILSDLSEGMLEQAQQNLNHNLSLFQFKVIDAQAIPFEENSFDVVIASHMLYHVPDRRKALLEIKRVIKPTGYFYATTIGCNHLKELRDLLSRFDIKLSSWFKLPSGSFNLENGFAQLRHYFAKVALNRYPDSLIVTNANLLTNYIMSGGIELSTDKQLELAKFVTQELEAKSGKIYITKDSGVFESKSIV